MNLNELTSTPSGRTSYPLDFSVQTESNEGDLSPVLYIENIDNAHDLHWNVVNAGSDEKYIQKLDGEPSVDNYHFQLKFRPGILADHFVSNPNPGFNISATDGVTWKMKVIKDDSSNIVYISLLASDITLNERKLVLKPRVPLNIIIDKVTADPVGGARNANVELRYNHIRNSGDTNNILSGNRMQHLGIVNHNGLRHIPLLPETMGSNTILNNGNPNPNDLPKIDIQITNYSKNDITLSHEGNDQSIIEIVLKAPLEDDKGNLLESGELFLAKKSDLNQVELIWADQEHWNKSTKEETPDSITWTIINNSQDFIESGQSLNFTLENVVTDLPAGTAKIQINYYNIPGYWDGSLHLDIVKSPLVFRDKKVGIGVNPPGYDVDIAGTVYIVDKLGIGIDPKVRLDVAELIHVSGTTSPKTTVQGAYIGWNALTGGTGETDFINHQGGGSGGFAFMNTGEEGEEKKTLLLISGDGSVEIGTFNPSPKFHVKTNNPEVGLFESIHTEAILKLQTSEGEQNRVEFANRPGGRAAVWVAEGGDALNILKNGNVGIGTTTPNATLQVQRGTASGGSAIFAGTRRASHFNHEKEEHTYIRGGKSSSNVLINDNGGNVGIGTAKPAHKLHVNGTAHINTLRVNDGIYVEGPEHNTEIKGGNHEIPCELRVPDGKVVTGLWFKRGRDSNGDKDWYEFRLLYK